MASIRKRGSNSYLIVVSRGYDYEGNRLKSVQKTVKPPKEYTPKQAEKWVKEQAILFEREVQHTPEPINRSITLAKYIEHWVADVGPKKLADSTFRRDEQDIRRILPALGNYSNPKENTCVVCHTMPCVRANATAQTASTVRNKIRISRFANTFIRHLYPFHL